MDTELAYRLVRKFAWPEIELVEGTEATLWPAPNAEAASAQELPPSENGVEAVLSWARSKVLRFETASPEPLANTLLVSTLAVSGPAHFVVHKSYQTGSTAVCDPPEEVFVVERRDLFRVAVATDVALSCQGGSLPGLSLDFSVGGLRAAVPRPLPVGAEVKAEVALGGGRRATVPARVRHCRLGAPAVVGLQFERLAPDIERQLTQFVGTHQRRLMPRVRAVVPIEYRSHGRNFLEAFATEVSPGDVVFSAHDSHRPGELVDVKIYLSHIEHSFGAHVLSNEEQGEEDGPRKHVVRLSLGEAAPDVEARFRKAIRELAIERMTDR
ncbi:MAG TPA: PilZ domain-containing protein [Acidimicrobiales bacterium]|nr:PilZ domain-containing protein [Acidimicrobiales bacterium]